MCSREHLEKETGDFFDLHWGEEAIPAWNFSWNWCGLIPNHDLDGVYALFSGGELVYVGLGAGRGHGTHKNHGLRKRLLAHVLELTPADSDAHYILEPRWRNAGVDQIATLGFPSESSYLAYALEHYLITKLDPPENHRNHAPRIH